MIENDENRKVLCVYDNQNGYHTTSVYFEHMRGVFQGVYPSDKLPASTSSYPALFIGNVDTSEKSGSHWVAFYFTREREGEFFDSYGRSPSHYTPTFTSFLDNNTSSWTFNSVQLQGFYSKVCGQYCLYFAILRCGNFSMNSIVHRFSSNKRRNDTLVRRIIEKRFPLKRIKTREKLRKETKTATSKVEKDR